MPSVGASEAGRRRERARHEGTRARECVAAATAAGLSVRCWPLLLLPWRRPRDNSCPLRVDDVGRNVGLYAVIVVHRSMTCSGNLAVSSNEGVLRRSVRPNTDLCYEIKLSFLPKFTRSLMTIRYLLTAPKYLVSRSEEGMRRAPGGLILPFFCRRTSSLVPGNAPWK